MTVLLLLLLIELCYGLISFIFIFLLSLDSLSQLADVMHGMSQMIGGIDPEKITLLLVLDLILWWRRKIVVVVRYAHGQLIGLMRRHALKFIFSLFWPYCLRCFNQFTHIFKGNLELTVDIALRLDLLSIQSLPCIIVRTIKLEFMILWRMELIFLVPNLNRLFSFPVYDTFNYIPSTFTLWTIIIINIILISVYFPLNCWYFVLIIILNSSYHLGCISSFW